MKTKTYRYLNIKRRLENAASGEYDIKEGETPQKPETSSDEESDNEPLDEIMERPNWQILYE